MHACYACIARTSNCRKKTSDRVGSGADLVTRTCGPWVVPKSRLRGPKTSKHQKSISKITKLTSKIRPVPIYIYIYIYISDPYPIRIRVRSMSDPYLVRILICIRVRSVSDSYLHPHPYISGPYPIRIRVRSVSVSTFVSIYFRSVSDPYPHPYPHPYPIHIHKYLYLYILICQLLQLYSRKSAATLQEIPNCKKTVPRCSHSSTSLATSTAWVAQLSNKYCFGACSGPTWQQVLL